jgi:hypothetical protein
LDPSETLAFAEASELFRFFEAPDFLNPGDMTEHGLPLEPPLVGLVTTLYIMELLLLLELINLTDSGVGRLRAGEGRIYTLRCENRHVLTTCVLYDIPAIKG